MTHLQIWLQNHNRKLTQAAIDEALMEYITHVEKQRDSLQEENARLKKMAKWDSELCSDHCASLEESICRQAEEIESLKADAERYRLLNETMQSAKGGAFLEVNKELGVYEKPESGKEVSLQWYPDTPVGFYKIEASTITEVLDALRNNHEQT